jgi:SMC interacting uncharacterized protein involved in chromosome segregation
VQLRLLYDIIAKHIKKRQKLKKNKQSIKEISDENSKLTKELNEAKNKIEMLQEEVRDEQKKSKEKNEFLDKENVGLRSKLKDVSG